MDDAIHIRLLSTDTLKHKAARKIEIRLIQIFHNNFPPQPIELVHIQSVEVWAVVLGVICNG